MKPALAPRKGLWRALSLGATALLLSAAGPPSAGRPWNECLDDKWFTDKATDTLKACVAASGPRAAGYLGLRLGASVRDMEEASSPGARLTQAFGTNRVAHTDEPLHVRWEAATGRQFVFDDVGGTGQAVLLLNLAIEAERLHSFSFAWQNRPLNLEEALERAKRLERWLREIGFTPGDSDEPHGRPFGVQGESPVAPARWAANWIDAERLLSAEAENVEEMALFTLSGPESTVTASLKNGRRAARNFGMRGHKSDDPLAGRTVFDRNGGYEWQLDIYVSRPD